MDRNVSYLLSTLYWSRKRDYRGYSKHDALNSPILSLLSFNKKILRLIFIQAIMRFPINIRPIFFVPRLRNPKGIGLFAHAWFDVAYYLKKSYQEESFYGTSKESSILEGKSLLLWLVENVSPWTKVPDEVQETIEINFSKRNGSKRSLLKGMGWGYHYPWQDIGFFQPPHFPNRVVSCWIGFAFIRGYELTGDQFFLSVAKEIVRFLIENPKRLMDTETELCLSYVPTDDIRIAVMDVSALSSALIAQTAYHIKRRENRDVEELFKDAKRLMRFVVNRQTDYGAWYYTWPASSSHITHDNYHTGIILDALADYMEYTKDFSFIDIYKSGLEFYRKELFIETGAPKWMHDRVYPHDIHGAATGILTFDRAASLFSKKGPKSNEKLSRLYKSQADKILKWTIEHLFHPEGYFYYQKTRFFTKRFNLMRWCNAWMCRALARHIIV